MVTKGQMSLSLTMVAVAVGQDSLLLVFLVLCSAALGCGSCVFVLTVRPTHTCVKRRSSGEGGRAGGRQGRAGGTVGREGLFCTDNYYNSYYRQGRGTASNTASLPCRADGALLCVDTTEHDPFSFLRSERVCEQNPSTIQHTRNKTVAKHQAVLNGV